MENPPPQNSFTAIVLAGDRGPNDPLAEAAGACCKALVEIEGTPMVLRVLDTLAASKSIRKRILSGPEKRWLADKSGFEQLINSGEVSWLAPQPTPSTSAYQAMQTLQDERPVLITTADHPLLTAEIVDYFCTHSQTQQLDVAVGLCEYERIRTAFPGIKKTVMKFRGGNYCGCNLFAFLTSDARRLADDWRQVESERKNPLRIIRLLGWYSVLRYLTGSLTLENALQRLSKKLGLRIGAVILPFPEAAVDVDTVADRLLVQKTLQAEK